MGCCTDSALRRENEELLQKLAKRETKHAEEDEVREIVFSFGNEVICTGFVENKGSETCEAMVAKGGKRDILD